MDAIFRSSQVESIIRLALQEDEIHDDITTARSLSFAQAEAPARGVLLLKEEACVCGLPLVHEIFRLADLHDGHIEFFVEEGAYCAAGTEIGICRAPLSTLLRLERTILNFLQRLSGVATKAYHLSETFPTLRLLDTRKTTPGLRLLEKYAVRTGGLENHRMSLADMILMKDNHIDASELPAAQLLSKVSEGKPKDIPIEIEVRNFSEFVSCLETACADRIMLDNFSLEEGARVFSYLASWQGKPVEIEISGGVNEEKIASWSPLAERAPACTICFSLGALTNHVYSVDISLKIKPEQVEP